MVVNGVGEQIGTIASVIALVARAEGRSWAGGPVQAALRYGEGTVPAASAVAAGTITPSQLVGGGATTLMRVLQFAWLLRQSSSHDRLCRVVCVINLLCERPWGMCAGRTVSVCPENGPPISG